jgi:hypothetical protein
VVAVDVPKGFSSQGVLALDVALRNTIGEERLLCSAVAGINSGMDSAAVLALLRDGLNANPTCVAQGVMASTRPTSGKEDDALSPRLEVRTTQNGTQLITRLRAHVQSVGFGFEGASDGARSRLTTPILSIVVPTDANGQGVGAAGGGLDVEIWTFEGPCRQHVAVNSGDSPQVIAGRVATALAFPGADCPGVSLPEIAFVGEQSVNMATLSLRGARNLFLRTTDPSLTLAMGSRSTQSPQIPPQAPPLGIQIFATPLPMKTDPLITALKMSVGAEVVAFAHSLPSKTRPSDLLGPEVAWSSSDSTVATVEGGCVVAKSKGKTTVMATFGAATTAIPVEITP